MNSVRILNARVLNGTMGEMIDMADEAIKTRKQIFGTGINLNQLYLMRKNPEFAYAIDRAVLCPPD